MPELGALKSIDLRRIWLREDEGFTPWLFIVKPTINETSIQALSEEQNMDHIQTFKIHDVENDEIYTAKIQKNGKKWVGWIQEHPKVKCEADTQDALLETLKNTLYQTLEADWQAWDKQLEADVKAGKLDATLERVSADFHAGECEDLAAFLPQDATEKQI